MQIDVHVNEGEAPLGHRFEGFGNPADVKFAVGEPGQLAARDFLGRGNIARLPRA